MGSSMDQWAHISCSHRYRRYSTCPMKTTANGHDGTPSHRSLLRSNLQLQRALGERIASINKRKERNRRAAGEAVAASLPATSGGDGGTGSISNRRVEELLDQRRLRLRQHQKVAADAATTSTCKSTINPTATATTPTAPGRKRKRSTGIKSARGWQQTPNRKWHRRYFVDAEGSTPQPNNDVARRAQWLRDVASSLPPDTLSYHHGSGGKEETGNGEEADDGDDDVVAIPQQQQRKTNAKKPKQKAASRRGNPLTAAERATVRAAFVESEGYPDWSRIIASDESAIAGVKKATAWDCFRYVQKEASSLLLDGGASGTNARAVARSSTSNSSLPSQPWGSDEDAALLTAVMSLGPQFTLSRDSVSGLARELFADRSVKQIKKRANESLVNPNYRSPAVRWTDEEERMLVLMMRAYGHCPSPLVKAFGHFPNVASKSISEKWSRLQGHSSNNNKGR